MSLPTNRTASRLASPLGSRMKCHCQLKDYESRVFATELHEGLGAVTVEYKAVWIGARTNPPPWDHTKAPETTAKVDLVTSERPLQGR